MPERSLYERARVRAIEEPLEETPELLKGVAGGSRTALAAVQHLQNAKGAKVLWLQAGEDGLDAVLNTVV